MNQVGTLQAMSLRLPTGLHAEATDIAKAKNISLTEYIVRALGTAVSQELASTPPKGGDAETFEVHLQFTLADSDPDRRAYGIVDGIENFLGLTGATDVTTRLMRLATMQPRS